MINTISLNNNYGLHGALELVTMIIAIISFISFMAVLISYATSGTQLKQKQKKAFIIPFLLFGLFIASYVLMIMAIPVDEYGTVEALRTAQREQGVLLAKSLLGGLSFLFLGLGISFWIDSEEYGNKRLGRVFLLASFACIVSFISTLLTTV